MPIEATSQTSPFPLYILFGNDDLNIAAGVTLNATGGDAVIAYSGQHSITLSGTIVAFDEAINTIGCEAAQYVEITATGIIVSGFESDVEDADGVILDGVGSVLVNHGSIFSQGSALQVFVRDGGTTTITNHGVMSADKYGVWNKFGSGTLDFTNFGTIESGLGSYHGGTYVDRVTNAGTMIGDVDLGGGDDLYVGTGGTVIGEIRGGSGNDRFVVGLSNEQIDGGDGVDTLDLSGLNQKMTVNLANPSANRGPGVVGDSYAGIENIIGTAYRDVLTGDGNANLLNGGGSLDKLTGGGGNDTLIGGNGADTLSGGAGADVFWFQTYADRGDVLLDFQTGVDQMTVNAAAFGFGSYTGALNPAAFVTGTTNHALDQNDRFIFRTTDATLWFDRDGTGNLSAVLLADLANGSAFVAGDMLLV